MTLFTELSTGERLRIARSRAGYKANEIADVLGVNVATVSQWETGKRLPRSAYILAMSRVYDVAPFDLYAPADIPDALTDDPHLLELRSRCSDRVPA